MSFDDREPPAGPQGDGAPEELPSSSLPSIDATDKDERVKDALPPVKSEPYDPRPHTTKMRGWLAIGMAAILAITVLLSFVLASLHQWLCLTIEQVNGFTAPVLSTEAALLGTALGFYFGDRSSP